MAGNRGPGRGGSEGEVHRTATGKAAQVPDALLAKVASLVTGSPTLPIAWPNVAFNPPADGKYLEVAYFSNRPAWEGVGAGVLDQGLLQITVHWPRGSGIIAPSQVVETIKAHFAKGTLLTSGSTVVRLNRAPWAAAPLVSDQDLAIPVTIPWVA